LLTLFSIQMRPVVFKRIPLITATLEQFVGNDGANFKAVHPLPPTLFNANDHWRTLPSCPDFLEKIGIENDFQAALHLYLCKVVEETLNQPTKPFLTVSRQRKRLPHSLRFNRGARDSRTKFGLCRGEDLL